VDRLRVLTLVAAGGALGAVARYVVGGLFNREGSRFPWGTLVINLSGCLALGFVLTLLDERLPESRAWRALVTVGFLGAYTTFSTFGWEIHDLVRSDAWGRATAYAAGSVVLGLAAVRLGVLAARAL
jgi:CrcB protein